MNIKSFTKLLSLITIGISSILLSACSNNGEKEFHTYADLNSIKPVIALQDDYNVNDVILENMPNAKLEYYNDISSAIKNLQSKKWDGVLMDEPAYVNAIRDGVTGISLLDPIVTSFDVALALNANAPITNYKEVVDNAIKKFQNDGTMKEMEDRWLREDSPRKMPDLPHNFYSTTILCATFGEIKPFTYYQDGELVGFDIELAKRVADEIGCNIQFETASFPSMLLGIEQGKYDMIASNLFSSSERQENVLFSIPYTDADIRIVVRDNSKKAAKLEYSSIDDLKKAKSFGVVTGTVFDKVVEEKFPNAKIKYYNDVSDCILAVKSKKIDAVLYDKPILDFFASQNDGVGVIKECLLEEDYYFAANKGFATTTPMQDLNNWLETNENNGKLKQLYDYWTSDNEPKALDFSNLPATQGTIRAGYIVQGRPDVFFYEGMPTGYPIELLYEFSKDTGYRIELIYSTPENFIQAIASNQVDIFAGLLSYTEERAQSVAFTKKVCTGGISCLVRTLEAEQTNFFNDIGNSFYKTCIKENRYKMIFKGLGVTLLITICGFLLANLFGAGFCSLAMSKNKFANAFAKGYSYFIQGTPLVVILMILYFIIFGKTRVPGEMVAIIGFGMVSGASLAQLFKGSIESVNKGQREASLALGFTRFETFKNIIFPQAARRALPSYFSELIALMKGTSIVGYIAVQDLTKMGDIIRSSTYEAFFPLIAVALIYFAFSTLLLLLLGRIQKLLAKKPNPIKEVNK